MSQTIRPIRDLWFRFIKNSEGLESMNAQDLASILVAHKLIELVPHKTKPVFEHYRDTDAMHELSTDDFWTLIMGAK